jgi:hypothetical protein
MFAAKRYIFGAELRRSLYCNEAPPSLAGDDGAFLLSHKLNKQKSSRASRHVRRAKGGRINGYKNLRRSLRYLHRQLFFV